MWVIVLTVILLYFILVLWTNANMYAFDKKVRVVSILIGIVITFVISVLLVLTSGVPNVRHEIRIVMNIGNILLFSAINALITIPTITKVFNRKKIKELSNRQVRNRIGIRIMIFVVMLFVEISYLHSFQNMMMKMR